MQGKVLCAMAGRVHRHVLNVTLVFVNDLTSNVWFCTFALNRRVIIN